MTKIKADVIFDEEDLAKMMAQLAERGIIRKTIHCKECKYWNEWGLGMSDDQCHCSRIDYWTNGDWFCADGERE